MSIYIRGNVIGDVIEAGAVKNETHYHYEGEQKAEEKQGNINNVNELPKELLTDEAQVLWQSLRDNGFIVADGYDLAKGVSNNQATYIADCMAERLDIQNKWKVFEQLWGIKHMAQMAGSWKQTGKEPSRANEIRELLE